MSLIVAEPPAAYLRRPRLVVDASVMAAAVFSESNQEDAVAFMQGRALCTPHLLDYEMSNAAQNKLRRRIASVETAVKALQKYAHLDIERFAVEPIQIFELAARYNLTAYDAAYLWLAAELKAPLATFDQTLGAAATKHLGSLGDT